ncbi:hypothetical protein ACI2KS_10390 [Pseudomonas sp. NPDC087358]|uniref:hypothetical protein n=1 Tax=Pseudomonas sp. NPDC087358 TaxID=3364439 RepID=UPI00384B539E
MNSAFVVRGSSNCCQRTDGAFTIMVGQRGAQGRPGTDSGGGVQTIICTAGETISALRVIYESQQLARPVNPATESVYQALGLAITSGSIGTDINIQTQGFVDDSSWSWTEGHVWCGANGVLTQTPPTTGWDFIIGFATSATRLYIDLNEPVLLA